MSIQSNPYNNPARPELKFRYLNLFTFAVRECPPVAYRKKKILIIYVALKRKKKTKN